MLNIVYAATLSFCQSVDVTTVTSTYCDIMCIYWAHMDFIGQSQKWDVQEVPHSRALHTFSRHGFPSTGR